jgi:hypothetical protein
MSGDSSDVASHGKSASQSNYSTSSFVGTILSNFSAGMQTRAKELYPRYWYVRVPDEEGQSSESIPLLYHKEFAQTLRHIIRSNAGGTQFVSKEIWRPTTAE